MSARIFQQVITGVRLPADAPVLRKHPVAAADRTAQYHAAFDRQTLIYDCVAQRDEQALLFTAPRFDNLWPVFRKALHVDGAQPRFLRRAMSGRCDQVRVRWRGGPVRLDLESGPVDIIPRQDLSQHFAGQNCLVTLQKDEPLEWIADWIRFHVAAQNLESVVIFDNASTTYNNAALAEVVASVSGVQTVAILSAPFPYGGIVSAGGKTVRLVYLQTALLNLARRDLLRRANAVLNADVDEMIAPLADVTVFQAARSARFGLTRLDGSWVYPESADMVPCAQAANRFEPAPPKRSNPKWCATPQGPVSRIGWNVHGCGKWLGGRIKADPRFHMLHCGGTTRNVGRVTASMPSTLMPSERAASAFDRFIPAESSAI